MPFVEAKHRDPNHKPCCVGDLCYGEYKWMKEMWDASPCWTTAHAIYKEALNSIRDTEDEMLATDLAWQVFFRFHVIPYEEGKRELNGEVGK